MSRIWDYSPEFTWEFNTLGIYDYKRPGHLDLFFNYIRLTESFMPGDIVEAGVFQGSTLLATGLLLRELGSKKRVFGFDSFVGFPKFETTKMAQDGFSEVNKRLQGSQKDQIERLQTIKHLQNRFATRSEGKTEINEYTLSSSGDFSTTSREHLEEKISMLGLTNIVLVEGFFEQTMNDENLPKSIYASFLDCDLYSSYKISLEKLWPRLNTGAFIYLDEYYSLKFLEAKTAVDEFVQGKEVKFINFTGRVGDEFQRTGIVKL